MAKTVAKSSPRELEKLRKEIDSLEQTLSSVRKSAGSAFMLKIDTSDPVNTGEYRVVRQYYHLRKDALNDMNCHFTRMFGKTAKPDLLTDSRMEYRRDDGTTFIADIVKITII